MMDVFEWNCTDGSAVCVCVWVLMDFKGIRSRCVWMNERIAWIVWIMGDRNNKLPVVFNL